MDKNILICSVLFVVFLSIFRIFIFVFIITFPTSASTQKSHNCLWLVAAVERCHLMHRNQLKRFKGCWLRLELTRKVFF